MESIDNNDNNNNNVSTIQSLKLERDTFIPILSSRRSGKSVLIADMIHYFLTSKEQHCDYLYMFSNTAGLNSGTNEQYKFIDKKCIIPAREDVMNKVIIGLMQSQKKTNFKFHPLIVFDDIVVSQKYKIIEYLASAGRHHAITVILSAQIANTVFSPTIKNNISYLFFRRLNPIAIQNNIYPIVGVMFHDHKELEEYTLDHIHDYQFIFFNNDKELSNDSLQIVKAQPVPTDFKYTVKYEDESTKIDKMRKKHKMDPLRGKNAIIPFYKNQMNPYGSFFRSGYEQ